MINIAAPIILLRFPIFFVLMTTQITNTVIEVNGKKYTIDMTNLTATENKQIINFINNGPADASIGSLVDKLDFVEVSQTAAKEADSVVALAANGEDIVSITLNSISKLVAPCREMYIQMLRDLHTDVLNNPLCVDSKYVNARYELAIIGAELSPQIAELHKTTLIWNIIKTIPELVVIAVEQYRPSSFLNVNNMLKIILQRATNLYELMVALDSISQTDTHAAINRAINSGDIDAEFLIKIYMLDISTASVEKLYEEYAGKLTSIIISECVHILLDNAASLIMDDMLRYSVHYIKQLKNIECILDNTPEECLIKDTINEIYTLKRAMFGKLMIHDLMLYKFIDQYYNPMQMYEIDFVYYISLRFKSLISNLLTIPYPLTNGEQVKAYISQLYNITDIATGNLLNPIDKLIQCIDDYREYYQFPDRPTKEEQQAGIKPLICLFEPIKKDRFTINYSKMLEHITQYIDTLFSEIVRPRNFDRYARDVSEVDVIYQLARVYRQFCYTKCSDAKINHLINSRLSHLTIIHKLAEEYMDEFIPHQSPPNLQTGFLTKPLNSADTKLLTFILTRLKIYHFLRFISRNIKVNIVSAYDVSSAILMYKQCMIYEFEPTCRLLTNMPLLEPQFYYLLANSMSVLIADVYIDTIYKHHVSHPSVAQYDPLDLIGESYMQLDSGIVVPRLLSYARLANRALYLVWLFIVDNRIAGQKRDRYITNYLTTYMLKLSQLIKTNRIQSLNHINLYYPGVFKGNALLTADVAISTQYKLLSTALVQQFVRMTKNYIFIDILSKYPGICNLRNKDDTFVITPELRDLFTKLRFKKEGILPYYECEYCNMREYCPSAVWVCRNCQKCVGHLYCICNNNDGTAPIECDCAYFD